MQINDFHSDPQVQFLQWQDEKQTLHTNYDSLFTKIVKSLFYRIVRMVSRFIPEVGEMLASNIVSLATADNQGKPSNRYVLLKGIKEGGYVFYTNYDSRKSRELEANPVASLSLYTRFPPRQIRLEGKVKKLSSIESDRYWESRSRGSQLSAMASAQSSAVDSFDTLKSEYDRLEGEYKGKKIPRPANWGGFVLIPNRYEFWEGRASRLHLRVQYDFEEGAWKRKILAP